MHIWHNGKRIFLDLKIIFHEYLTNVQRGPSNLLATFPEVPHFGIKEDPPCKGQNTQ